MLLKKIYFIKNVFVCACMCADVFMCVWIYVYVRKYRYLVVQKKVLDLLKLELQMSFDPPYIDAGNLTHPLRVVNALNC